MRQMTLLGDISQNAEQDATLSGISNGGKTTAPVATIRFSMLAILAVLVGAAAIALPTMITVARETWSTEQGAHGPIVLLTGIWLLWTRLREARPLIATPPAWRGALLVLPLLAAFVLARITQIIELEGYLMYGVLLAVAYSLLGARALIKMGFPLLYLAFIFPPPETVIYAITMPMKIAISEGAVSLLRLFDLPIGVTGVTIQIGQYQLLVAAACSGLNSIVSLSALTIFYIYVRHSSNMLHAVILMAFVIPVAMAANFIRVLMLVLITYYLGESAAQGFMHELAGVTMFAVALLLIFALDSVLGRIFGKRWVDPSLFALSAGGDAS
jgi:exosortase